MNCFGDVLSMISLKIATWNVNSINARLPHILKWLADESPDVLVLQEIKVPDERFPLSEIVSLGFEVNFSGQKAYNGVALISRSLAQSVVKDLPGWEDPQKRVIAATINDIRIVNLYVPNGQAVGSDKYQYKLNWLDKMRDYLAGELKKFKHLVVLGDFNIAPEGRDVYDPAAWEGQILVSEGERARFDALLDLGLTDSFRLFEKGQGHYTWWDYRAGSFRRDLGLRIDHILLSPALTAHCKSCHIDKEPRGWQRPSDHAIVMAAFSF